jgi:hypothetical protein
MKQLAIEASALVALCAREAEIACLDTGKYWTVKPGARIPSNRVGLMVFFGNPAQKNGQAVDTVIPVVVEDHPVLQQAIAYSKSINDHRLQEVADRFNAKDRPERERLLRQHENAYRMLLAGPPEELRNDEERSRLWRESMLSQLLGWDVRVDPGTLLMSRR